MKDQTSSTSMPPYSFENFKDNNITTTSLENLGGHPYDHHQSLLLDDIDQYLSEVLLPQPEPVLPTNTPEPEYHHLDAPYTKEYDLFQEGYGPIPIHKLPQVGYQTLHQQGPEIKNADEAIEDSRGKRPILEHERMDGHHHQQDSLTRRAQKRRSGNRRRRERINANIKAIQELIPHCGKGNHATILERAIEYIKSLKLHINEVSRSRSEQGQFQATYATQMMTQPWPRMFHGIRPGAWIWGSQVTQTGYPTLNPIVGLGGFGGGVQIQPMPHAPAVPFTPILCRLPCYTTPIMSPPTPVVFPFAPPQSQSTPTSSFNQVPHSHF